jgi:hypothetical protein
MSEKAYYLAQAAIVGAFILVATGAAGCEVIGDIFKAGMWIGIIVVVLVVLVIAAIVRRFRQ